MRPPAASTSSTESPLIVPCVATGMNAGVSIVPCGVSPHWMGGINGAEGTKVTGSAMMMAGATPGTTTVSIEIKGDTPGAVRPWHVHVGSCAKSASLFGGMASYKPVTIDANGSGKSSATLPVATPDSGSFHVNVHESSANMGKYAGCGDLKAM